MNPPENYRYPEFRFAPYRQFWETPGGLVPAEVSKRGVMIKF
jgi:hypothetical protein